MEKKTLLLLIATGPEMYERYAQELIRSADNFFVPHETLIFTDSKLDFGVHKSVCPTLGFPDATLMRYHMFSFQREFISRYDYCFYCDVDMEFQEVIGKEIFGRGITAVRHKGFNEHTWDFYLEQNPKSTAYMTYPCKYYCGGFNGGPTEDFLRMSDTIRARVSQDARNGITAKWHDESHLNKYLDENPPAVVLSPDYCYPSAESHPSRPKIKCLEKSLASRTVRQSQ